MNKKRICILVIVICTFIFSLIGTNKVISKSNIDLLSFLSNNNLEVKELSEVTNSMYVTMLDKKAKVIATTNPNTQVEGKYAYTDTSKPQVQPNTTDNYFILFNINDTNSSNGYTKVEDNVIYTLDLPEYIIPSNAYEEGINASNKCTDFTKTGKSIACGGVYQKRGKYQFQVIFKDTLNKKDVKAAYQFPINLNKTIEDVPFSIKTIDFGLPGAIQLYIETEKIIEPEQGSNYTLKFENNGWTSSTKNYTKWTATITDNHTDGYKMNGTLYINFGPDMGMPTNQYNLFDKLKVYADGEELTANRAEYGEYNYYSYLSSNIVKALMHDTEELDFESTTSPFSYLIKGLKIELNQFENENKTIEGIKEWKFEFITKEYHDDENYTFKASAKFIDSLDSLSVYEKHSQITKESHAINARFENSSLNLNEYNTPETIQYNLKINDNSKDILEIYDIPSYKNNTNYQYYMDGLGFHPTINSLSQSLKININNQDIAFNYGPTAPSMTVNYSPSFDPIIQKYMKKLGDYYERDTNTLYYKSDETNPDGDNYWIAISKDTFDLITSDNSNGRFDLYSVDNKIMPTPAPWKVYLLNAKGQDIEVSWKENLQYLDNSDSDLTAGKITNHVEINGSSYETEATFEKTSPLKIKSSILEDGYIKWDVKMDLNSVFLQGLNRGYIIIYLPKELQVFSSSSSYYDYNANRIIYNQNRTSIYTNKSLFCKKNLVEGLYDNGKCLDYNNYYINNYMDTFNSSFSYVSNMAVDNYNIIDNKYNISKDNFNTYSIFISDGNIDSNNNILKVSFVTRNTENNSRQESYSKEIYVDVMLATFRKKFDRELSSNYSGSPEPYFSIASKGEVVFPSIKKEAFSYIYRYEGAKKINNWDITGSTDMTTELPTYELDTEVNNKTPTYFSGKYQFTDKFQTNSAIEEIIAKNTKLYSLTVYYNNSYDNDNTSFLYFSNNDLENSIPNSEGYYNVCNNNINGLKKCLQLKYNYGSDCINYSSSNNACSKENENMKNGFEVIAEGFNKSKDIIIQYQTIMDLDGIASDLKEVQFENQNLSIRNQAKLYDWKQYSLLSQTSSSELAVMLLGDISIQKKVNHTNETNYMNDTKTHTLVSTIGHTPTDYLDITDFIDGIGSIGLRSSSKDPNTITTNMNDLKEIRKYLHIRDLKIEMKDSFKNNYNTIYSNGNFISEYEDSTLEFIEGTNELYQLHLVKSNGEKIPANTDIKITYTMNFYLDETVNYRLKDIYTGKKFYISTNAEAIRTYESNPNIEGTSSKKEVSVKRLSSQDGNYENKIDSTNKTLTVYASNAGVEVGADYLYPPSKTKTRLQNESNEDSQWLIQYDVNSTGKEKNVSMNIKDTIYFEIDGNSTYNDNIASILNKYAIYKNIKIYYNGKNTSLENNPIYEWSHPFENKNISIGNITGKLIKNSNSYELQLSSFNYGDIIMVTYDIDMDYESALREMIDNGYINENMKLTDTNQVLSFYYKNRVTDFNYPDSFSEKSSSKISISDYTPVVHKKNNGTSNDETSWEINFHTGISSSNIIVKDNLLIKTEEEALQSIIEEATILKDLQIKVGDEIVYTNGEFAGTWNNNITIQKNQLGYEFLLKDTTDNSFIADNKNVVITYKSCLDFNKYKGKNKNGVYSLENTVTMEKDGLKSKDVVESNGISYDFPLQSNKEFLGNSENDLTETNWKYTIESGKMDRENLHIKDTSALSEEFGKYLSISKLKITNNNEIIYDSSNNINQLEGIDLLDSEGNTLKLNQNGVYQFELVIEKLSKMSTITVEYSLKVDKEEYISNDEILDNELLIENNLKVESDDGTVIENNDRGSSKVTSKLIKKFDFLGYDNDGNPKMKWYIDVNLLSDYSTEELTEKEVIITDALSDILKLVDETVVVKAREVTSNGEQIGNIIDPSKYELSTENNTVKIKLLEPVNTPNLEISFETLCYASLSEIDNYATLQVGEETTEIKSANEIQVFSPYAFGVVSSRDVLTYHIKAKKYLDEKLSNQSFVFEAVEVNESGKVIENGFHSRNTNAEDGEITFNGIGYFDEGIHYYKIKEIAENNNSIIYDPTEYLLKVEVAKSDEDYVVEEISLVGNDSEEIAFHNKTKQQEESSNIINVIVNPQTGRIFITILIIPIIILIERYLNRKKYTN